MGQVKISWIKKPSINQLLQLIIEITIINCAFVTVISGHVYLTANNSRGERESVSVNNYPNVENWKECEIAVSPSVDLACALNKSTNFQCREHEQCRSFHFVTTVRGDEPTYFDQYCSLMKTALEYGSLRYDGAVSGQLESTSKNASLVWAGIGKFSSRFYRGSVDIADLPYTHKECQDYLCNWYKEINGFECSSYEIYSSSSRHYCYAHTTIYTSKEIRTETAYSAGIRADLNTSEVEIFGDTANTRVVKKNFPSPPPDIGETVPSFTETDYHFATGLHGEDWETLETTATEKWENCSVECHRNDACMSFMFYWDSGAAESRCDLYDVAIVGNLRPGYDTYGIIDRSKEEGAVRSLEVHGRHYLPLGRRLLSFSSVSSMEDCAKHCYNFYQPRICLAFFYDGKSGKCHLHDALPCVGNLGANSAAFRSGVWDASFYHFAYFEERIPNNLHELMNSCGMEITTTASPITTTLATDVTAKKAAVYTMQSPVVCHTSAIPKKQMTNELSNVSSAELRLICTHYCFINRDWCRAYEVDEEAKVCKLYDHVLLPGDGENNCVYGQATRN